MNYLNRREFMEKAGAFSSGIAIGAPALAKRMNTKNPGNELAQETIDSVAGQLSHLKAQHPSLHFDAQKLKQLRQQANGTHQRYAQRLYQWVDENKSWSPPKVTGAPGGAQGDEMPLEESAAFVTNAALAFCLSQQDEHLEIARKWALQMCQYPAGVIKNYGIGVYAAGLARAFDWLYHDLSTEDRDTIKASVVDIVSQMYQDAQPGAEAPSWWAKAYLHHDFWIPMGGSGEAALALIGEIEEANQYAAFARANFDTALSWMGDDGAWHEGVADWCYAMAPMLWFYGAWDSVTGENLHDIPWLQNTAAYRLYHWLPNNHYVNLNDSFRSGRYSTSGSASCHLLRRLASLFRDGHAQWLAEKDEVFDFKPSPKGVYQAPYETLSFRPEPQEYPHPESQTATWNMLWYDPTVEPVSPTRLPPARHFTDMGTVMMRTGWDTNEAVVSFACAPPAGHVTAKRIRNGDTLVPNCFFHDHIDYNSFTLFADGQYFIIPAGYARRTSNFQNVVCVNGADFSSDPSLGVKVTGFRNEKNFSYAVGDATEGFLPQLGVQRYRRQIVLFENRWLLVFDDLRLSEEGQENWRFNNFSWTVHSDPNTHTVAINERQVAWKSEGGKQPLSMYVMEPQAFGWKREVFQSIKGEPMMEALRLSKPEFYDDKKQVLTAWSWKEVDTAPQPLNHPDFSAVLLPDNKAVGFATQPGVPSDFSEQALSGRDMLLFGTNPDQPDAVVRVKNGKVQ